MADVPTPRAILRAELLAIGTELTVGETLDTNSGELARSLVAHGVTVLRVANLPDDQAVVVAALRDALARADLVVTTGGLGPTPDDLTRESVAELCGEAVDVDAPTLDWLRGPVGAAPAAVPRGQHEAGLAHPVGDDAAQPERHGARLVGRPSGRRADRDPARPAARDAADVGGRGAAAAGGTGRRRRTSRCARCG